MLLTAFCGLRALIDKIVVYTQGNIRQRGRKGVGGGLLMKMSVLPNNHCASWGPASQETDEHCSLMEIREYFFLSLCASKQPLFLFPSVFFLHPCVFFPFQHTSFHPPLAVQQGKIRKKKEKKNERKRRKGKSLSYLVLFRCREWGASWTEWHKHVKKVGDTMLVDNHV